MSTFSLLDSFLNTGLTATLMANITLDSQIWTPVWTNHSTRALMRIDLTDLGCKALSLAVDAHVLRSVRRWLSLWDRDGINIRLTSTHSATVQISSIALALCFLDKVLFEFLVCQMLLVLRAGVYSFSWTWAFENIHSLIGQRRTRCFGRLLGHSMAR